MKKAGIILYAEFFFLFKKFFNHWIFSLLTILFISNLTFNLMKETKAAFIPGKLKSEMFRWKQSSSNYKSYFLLPLENVLKNTV